MNENSFHLPKFTLEKVLYPEIKAFNEGKLKVSEVHTLWYAQYGNPEGVPVVVLHGGPGADVGPMICVISILPFIILFY